MEHVPAAYYLVVSAIMFAIGAFGVMVRRNIIVVFMCVELMLNAVNVTFVALSKELGVLDGQIVVVFVMVVAAAEAAIGLGIILSLFSARRSLLSSEASTLRL